MTDSEAERLLIEVNTETKASRELLQKVADCIYGNGKPGILARLTQIETKLEERKNSCALLMAGAALIISAIGGLKAFFS